MLVEAERLVGSWKVDLFLPLGQPGDAGALDAETIERCQRCIQLPTAAIDENEIRQRLILIDDPPVAAVDGFSHGAEVVRPDYGLDVEDAVLLFVHLSVLENHHPRDRIASLDVRDVEGFDLPDRLRMTDQLAQSRRCDLEPILLRLPESRLVRETSVPVRQVHPIDASPPLRRPDTDSSIRLGREPDADDLFVLDGERQKDLIRNKEVI